jgi:sec-independent protein translocase protein TatA
MDLGAPELLIILVIVALLFGANKLPGLARGMGSAVSEFRKGQAEGAADHPPATDARPTEEPTTPATPTTPTTTGEASTPPTTPTPTGEATAGDPAAPRPADG